MNFDPMTPNNSRLKKSARQRFFSSEKRLRHTSAEARQIDDAVTQMRYQVQRNEQWIYL